MGVGFLDPFVAISPAVGGSFQEVDLSTYVPHGSSGVILTVRSSLTTPVEVGWRKKGSTDNRTDPFVANYMTWLSVGVDENRRLELYQPSPYAVYHLAGHYSGESAHFFTNAIEKTPLVHDEIVEIDIGPDIGGDKAIAACLEITGSGSWGVWVPSETVFSVSTMPSHAAALVGMESNVFLASVSAGVRLFLVGYLRQGALFHPQGKVVTPPTQNVWVDLTALPSPALGGIYKVLLQPNTFYGLRKKGDTANTMARGPHTLGLVPSSDLGVVQGYTDSLVGTTFVELGYFLPPPLLVAGSVQVETRVAARLSVSKGLPKSFLTAIAPGTLTVGTTAYLPLLGTEGRSADEIRARLLMPCQGFLHHLLVQAVGNTTTTDSRVTLRLEGTDTTLSVTIPAGSTALHSQLHESIEVDAGNWVSLRLSAGGGGQLSDIRWSIGFTANQRTRSIVSGMTSVTVVDQNRFHPLIGWGGVEASEALAQVLLPTSGVLSDFHARAGTNTAFGALEIALRNNETDTSIKVQVPAGSTDLYTSPNSAPIGAGRRLGYRLYLVGPSVGVSFIGLSLTFEPSVGREALFMALASVSISANQTLFLFPTGRGGYLADQTKRSALIAADGILKKLYVQAGTNTLNGSCQVVVVKNGVDTSLSATIAAGSTAVFSDTTHEVAVELGDLITLKILTGGSSGSLTQLRASFVFQPLIPLTVRGRAHSDLSAYLQTRHPVLPQGTVKSLSDTVAKLTRMRSAAGNVVTGSSLNARLLARRLLESALASQSGARARMETILRLAGHLGSQSQAMAQVERRLLLGGAIAMFSVARAWLQTKWAFTSTLRAMGALSGRSRSGLRPTAILQIKTSVEGRLASGSELVGVSQGLSGNTAILERQAGLKGQIDASSAVRAATLAIDSSLVGKLFIRAQAFTQLELQKAMRSRSQAFSSAKATLIPVGSLTTTVAARADLTVYIKRTGSLFCLLSGKSRLRATIVASRGLSGNSASRASLEAVLLRARSGRVALFGRSSVVGRLARRARLAAAGEGSATVTGRGRLDTALFGQVNAISIDSGSLQHHLPLLVLVRVFTSIKGEILLVRAPVLSIVELTGCHNLQTELLAKYTLDTEFLGDVR